VQKEDAAKATAAAAAAAGTSPPFVLKAAKRLGTGVSTYNASLDMDGSEPLVVVAGGLACCVPARLQGGLASVRQASSPCVGWGAGAAFLTKSQYATSAVLSAAEWQSAAAQLYDPEPLLRSEQDASAAALAERQRDGGKSVTLADCLEVGPQRV
jgi:hypothetical protein